LSRGRNSRSGWSESNIWPSQSDDTAFREGLRDLGYVEGKNLQIEYRTAAGYESRVLVLAKELAGLNVDVIVTQANGVVAAVHATSKIPIVMAVGPDLVGLGFAASLAHPGGNVTGSTFFVSEVMAKRLELLKELAPYQSREWAYSLCDESTMRTVNFSN